MGRYKEIIPSQLLKLQKLISLKTSISIILNGTNSDLFYQYPFRIIYVGNKLNEYEFPALNILYQNSLQKNTIIGYLHSKGVSKTKDNSPQEEIEKSNHWRENMMKSNIENWKDIFFGLKYADACGWKWVEDVGFMNRTFGIDLTNSRGYFEGNFWWTTSNFIQTLPSLNLVNKKNRWEAEMWIGKSFKKPKRYLCLQTGKIYQYN